MCRNIRTLHNFQPPATDEEIHAAALQFVRKLCGFTRPSKTNELAFGRAVEQVTEAAHELLDALVTNAPPRDREVEARKARARSAERDRHRHVVGGSCSAAGCHLALRQCLGALIKMARRRSMLASSP